MKHLKDYINESINESSVLNTIDKTLDDDGLKQLIVKYIKENYYAGANSNLDILNFVGKQGNKFIVDFSGEIELRNDVPFTNDLFVWGKVKKFMCRLQTNYTTKLKSFKDAGLPMHVDGDFVLSDFKSVRDLEGLPVEVGGELNIYGFSKLTSLNGITNNVGGTLTICSCQSLKKLDYLPSNVGGGITINHNHKLESIAGLSDITDSVNGNLYLNGNFNLYSLEGCPSTVSGDFNIEKCKKLDSLEGCPSTVSGDFYCKNCAARFTKSEVTEMCSVGGNVDAYSR